ncbi:MAG TPA: hypothetical protein PKD37_04730 [Oligoflexia bacterium]|nr:hypothetical protein [Oligoflexia bacterium]HMP27270.1 hypothetical protein [Oligoflexia bacterium]
MNTDRSNRVSAFWFIGEPHFYSALYIAPPATEQLSTELSSRELKLTFFDCDGRQINNSLLELEPKEGIALDLAPFIDEARLNRGLRHGMLMLESLSDYSAEIVLQQSASPQTSFWLTVTKTVPPESGIIFPVNLEGNLLKKIVVLTNVENQQIELAAKLLVGNRKPEINITLPSRGSTVMTLANFLELVDDASFLNEESCRIGYLKLTLKNKVTVLYDVLTLEG